MRRWRPSVAPMLSRTPQFGSPHHPKSRGSCWLAGCWSGSYDQGGNECGEQGFAATACVVHELEEAEVVRQLVLRDAPVRAQPGAQQRPEPLDGVDVHLAEPIPVLVAGVFAAPMAAHGSPWQPMAAHGRPSCAGSPKLPG